MKQTSLKIILLSAAVLMAVSCGSDHGSAGPAAVALEADTAGAEPVSVCDLSAVAAAIGSAPEGSARADSLLRAYASPLTALVRLCGAGDTADVATVRALMRGRVMEMFYPEVRRVIPSPDSLASVLTGLSARLGRMLPDVKMPAVYTVVSPYNQSVMLLGDTAVFLALNHYLGPDHPAYSGFAEFVRRNKRVGRIPLDLTEALVSSGHPFAGGDTPTVLARLLYEGAVIESVMRLTGVSETEALGYTPDEMRLAEDNEARAWDTLLKRRMIFSTDTSLATQLTAPSPATTVLSPEAPGRLGRFIGHRIVASYLKSHPSAPLSELLSPEFYASQSALASAAYAPE